VRGSPCVRRSSHAAHARTRPNGIVHRPQVRQTPRSPRHGTPRSSQAQTARYAQRETNARCAKRPVYDAAYNKLNVKKRFSRRSHACKRCGGAYACVAKPRTPSAANIVRVNVPQLMRRDRQRACCARRATRPTPHIAAMMAARFSPLPLLADCHYARQRHIAIAELMAATDCADFHASQSDTPCWRWLIDTFSPAPLSPG